MLKIKNLKKGFPSNDGASISVVDVEDFSLDSGDMIALHGQSGSGKTTFLNLIAGIVSPDQGTLTFNGSSLSELSESQRDCLRASSIGYVYQSFNLLQGCTVLENLLIAMSFGGSVEESRAHDMLHKVDLVDRMNFKPSELSIGQQQRVALARALINRPTLLLADEPTGSLDDKNANRALTLLRELCTEANTGMILVSHDSKVISGFEKKINWSELNRSSPVSSPL